jgi:tRNA threonylcarbamoyladenosine biosynthesis protein TsaE
MWSLDLPDEAATRALGARLGRLLQPGAVIALYGELGAGKTTLARGLIQTLSPESGDIPSPTYTLVQVYDTATGPVWHFDLFRLKQPDEVVELGWQEAADGIMIIEWPERAGRYLPAARLDVHLEMSGEGRRARLEPHGEGWQERLDDDFARSAQR